jgi:hypothetical protein
MPAAMLPMARLTAPGQAHAFVRALTLAHLDASLRGDARARDWLDSGVTDSLADQGIDAWEFPRHVTSRTPASSS